MADFRLHYASNLRNPDSKTGIIKFKAFLDIEKINYSYTDVSSKDYVRAAICNVHTLAKFGQHLKEEIVQKPASAQAYLGHAKEWLKKLFPDDKIWEGHNKDRFGNSTGNPWYSELRDSLGRDITSRCILRGE